MSFLNPTYLWALFALVIPLAIHLWSRRKVETIKVGSTEFLELTNPKQTNSMKLNELGLLLLRMLTLALLVLLLAGLQIKTDDKSAILYFVEPSLMDNEKILPIFDSLPESELRYLAKGFPRITTELSIAEKNKVPNYWQLAKEMESLQVDSLVIFTQGFLKGVKGIRPETSANINWVVLEAEEYQDEMLWAERKQDSLEIVVSRMKGANLSFQKQKLSNNSEKIAINLEGDFITLTSTGKEVPLYPQKNIEIVLVGEDSVSQNMRYLKSAFKAIAKYLDRNIETRVMHKIDVSQLGTTSHLIWLAENEPPVISGRVLIYRPDDLASDLIKEGNSKNQFLLTQELNSENIVKTHLGENLIRWMNLYPHANEKIEKVDGRVVDIREISTNVSEKEGEVSHSQLLDVSPWLLLVLGVLLALERLVAKFRKQ